MRKLITLLFLASSIQLSNAENTTNTVNKISTNTISNISTNSSNVDPYERDKGWRAEAAKYPLYPCADIILKERNAQYFGNKYK